MSLTILTRPDRSLAENPARVSRWQSARQPYLFTFARRDSTIISFVDNGGKLRIVSNDTDAASQTVVGSTIYIGSSNYNTVATVTAITGVYIFDTDIDYDGPASLGWFNLLDWANFYVEVKITGTSNGVTGVWHTLRAAVPKNGDVVVDLAPYLTGYIQKQQVETTSASTPDPYVWGSFLISYRPGYAGNTNIVYANDPLRYYFTDGVKQLLSTYGQNFAGHVVFPYDNTEKARFLSDFLRPTYWDGYPFDLSVIIGEGNDVVGLYSSEDRFDVNGVSLSTGFQPLTFDTGIIRVTPIGGYGANVDSFDFWLQTGDTLPMEYFEDDLVDDGYIESIPAVDVPTYQVTEKKRIKIGSVCKNPVFISWRNSLGGWSYWLFQKTQEYDYKSKIDGVFGTEPEDVATANARTVITGASMTETIRVGATIENEDVTGFRFLESSPCILMYQSPGVWLRVQINPKGVKYRTDGVTTTVEFDLVSPEFYTVPN